MKEYTLFGGGGVFQYQDGPEEDMCAYNFSRLNKQGKLLYMK